MSRTQQCPVCFGDLEVRKVEPCIVCGGWPDIKPSKPEHRFKIRGDGTAIILCNLCWLEEVLSDQGDLKKRLRITGERDLVITPDLPAAPSDKFCPACNRRFALLEAMVHRLSNAELQAWRQ
jgi:hypothetical protein